MEADRPEAFFRFRAISLLMLFSKKMQLSVKYKKILCMVSERLLYRTLFLADIFLQNFTERLISDGGSGRFFILDLIRG